MTAENIAPRLKQADVDHKLTSFNRLITLNKTKHLEVQKKLNSIITNNYNFFGGVEFILQVMMGLKTDFFINQHLMLQNLKKTKVLIMFLIYVPNRKSKELLNSKLKPFYNAS